MAKSSYKGIVKDEFGETLPFATVNSLSDPTIWTETDLNGEFYITAEANDMLQIRMLGYASKNILAAQINNNIILSMDATNELNEIEIIATKPKKNYIPIAVALGLFALLGGAVYVSKKDKSSLAGAKKRKKKAAKKKTKRKSLNAGVVTVSI